MKEMDAESDRERHLRESGLDFFGKVTASASHDLSNVLSTIGQFSGLLQDMISGASEGTEVLNPVELRRVAEGIATHLQRGTVLTRRLNRFAHSPDRHVTRIDGIALVDAIVELARRLARLREIQLETDLSSGPIPLSADLFLLQQAIFLAVETAVLSSDPGGNVSVSAAAQGNEIHIAVSSRSPIGLDDFQERLSLLTLLLEASGGTAASLSDDAGNHRLVMTMPLADQTGEK